jgi:hypothetical protein
MHEVKRIVIASASDRLTLHLILQTHVSIIAFLDCV